MLKNLLINFLKKRFYKIKLYRQLSPSTQIQQVKLFHYYIDCLRSNNLPNFNATGFKVFSQFEEDGKLLYIFSILGMGKKTFVDLGSNDCVNSNCANLAVHFNWKGLFVDGDKNLIEIGKRFYKKTPNFWSYKPKFVHAFLTKKNVNNIIQSEGFEGEIELLSIDIDGNDYWIWESLEIIQPKVVIIECQLAFGLEEKVIPYREDFREDVRNSDNYGASALELQKLGKQKGYRLVGANEYGNNLFFIKNGLAEVQLPEVSVQSLLQHPFATEKYSK
ncbi:hypothetical protein [Flavobacterium dankookense]|uniref:FkbM family methyltransferase n=1 Tax=Flavobacterium dankookense TaxID=706186 RepID=A0A4R6QGC3_9FLAO|nr:hypothetical protein [Flavobacterium dankookense]TDP61003.1 hypothetical protein BC748_0610 [Flavobacterium dankookense]